MITDHHLAMLESSGITPEHAEARGCETITDSRRLKELGFVKAALGCVPGLLFPLLDARGSTWGYQYRPDNPRWGKDGKPVKYETPFGQHNGIDVPPGVGDYLGDPAVALFITEGTKKADCAAQYQMCCVALIGVWGFRGTGVKATDCNSCVRSCRAMCGLSRRRIRCSGVCWRRGRSSGGAGCSCWLLSCRMARQAASVLMRRTCLAAAWRKARLRCWDAAGLRELHRLTQRLFQSRVAGFVDEGEVGSPRP